MDIKEIPKFCDAILKRVLEKLKKFNLDVKHGYAHPDLSNEDADMSCPICDNAIESTDHLFFRCGLVRDIANKVLSWWNLDHANLNSYAEWKSWLVSIRMDSKLKKMLKEFGTPFG
ncbi:hypothetical protein Tco_1366889, partial [Tanacetum coccineum]